MLVMSYKWNCCIACSCSLLAWVIEGVFIDSLAYSNRNQPASVFIKRQWHKRDKLFRCVKAKRISPSSVFIDRQTQMFCDLGGWLGQHAWPALHTLPSDLAFCCVGLTHNSSLISHSGHPVRTDCRTRFPVSIKLSACESLNKICEDKGETQSKTGTEIKLNHLKLHKKHLAPLRKSNGSFNPT